MASRLSILIITYNRPADLLELLIDLNKQEHFDDAVEEVFVLNNASSEDYTTVTDYISAHPELKIRYIWSDENLGVAKGRNKLIGLAKGELLLSIDDDMVFTKPDDLLVLSGYFDDPYFKEANAAVITFRVIYYENRQVQVTAFPHKMYDKYKDKPRFLTLFFAGGAHVMKRKVLEEVGIYPEDFHYGMEEYDIAYRIVGAGYAIGYDGRVTVAHKESPLGRQPSFKKVQMQWVNKSKVAWRYLPFKYFVTTAVSWGIQFLRIAPKHIGAFFSGLAQVIAIPFNEKRKVLSKSALDYLKRVEARLKY